jgi:hypothetical protein
MLCVASHDGLQTFVRNLLADGKDFTRIHRERGENTLRSTLHLGLGRAVAIHSDKI